jgi:hypothetical protein
MADEVIMSESEKKKEDWMNSKWRPMMGWMYMGVCAFDFVIAPILWSLLQAIFKGGVNVQWQPLTLQGAGLFHVAMGAVLGLAAYGRTQEKLAGANNGGLNLGSGTTYTPPAPMGGSGFGGTPNATTNLPAGGASTFGAPAPMAPAFGSTPLGGNTMSTAPAFGSTPAPAPSSFGGGGFGGAPAPSGFPAPPAPGGGSKIAPPAFPPI